MAGKNGVTIIIAGKDETGAVFQAVQAQMEKTAAAATELSAAEGELAVSSDEAAGGGRRLQTQLGLVDNAMRGQASRAVADIIRSMSGLSVVMDLLPIAAVVAGFVVMGKFAEEGAKKFNHWADGTNDLNEKMGPLVVTLGSEANALTLSNAKMQDTIAGLSGTPGDGFKVALLEAADAADKLSKKLDEDLDKMQKLIEQNKISFLGKLEGSHSGDISAALSSAISKYQQITPDFEDAMQRAARSGNAANFQQIRSDELQTLQTAIGPDFKVITDYLEKNQVLPGEKESETHKEAAEAYRGIADLFRTLNEQAEKESGELQIAKQKGAQRTASAAGGSAYDPFGARERIKAGVSAIVGTPDLENQMKVFQNIQAQGAADDAKLAAKLYSLADMQKQAQAQEQDKLARIFKSAPANVVMGKPDSGISLAEIQGASEKFAHAIFDPLFNLSESWDKRWKQMRENLLRSLGQMAESQLFNVFFGDPEGRGGKSWNGGSFKGDTSNPIKHTGLAADAIGGLIGMFNRKRTATTSNGGVGSGAGTIPTPAASVMQMGKTGTTGGVQVIIQNNGAPVTAASASHQNDGGEAHVVNIILKQLETNGPVAQGIAGMLGGLG